MWTLFLRYRALDPEARKLYTRAVALLPLIALSLHLRGFKKTREALQERRVPGLPVERTKEQRAKAVEKTCRMVRAAAHYGMVRPTCLVESLALWHLLDGQSIAAQLRIGVRKLSRKFEAHAWVEVEGVALNQAQELHKHYAAFDSAFSDMPPERS
jgi:Transglutaminase-like superfamily